MLCPLSEGQQHRNQLSVLKAMCQSPRVLPKLWTHYPVSGGVTACFYPVAAVKVWSYKTSEWSINSLKCTRTVYFSTWLSIPSLLGIIPQYIKMCHKLRNSEWLITWNAASCSELSKQNISSVQEGSGQKEECFCGKEPSMQGRVQVGFWTMNHTPNCRNKPASLPDTAYPLGLVPALLSVAQFYLIPSVAGTDTWSPLPFILLTVEELRPN